MKKKWCWRCRHWKDATEENFWSTQGCCRPCAKAYKRERYRKNHQTELTRVREANWKRYGLSPEDYKKILAGQDGKCAICKTSKPTLQEGPRGTLFHVDHDHKTGRVRGLLCTRCNHSLWALEDEGWKSRAEEYLAAVLFSGSH